MKPMLERFGAGEDGAVTVDWVVLTAAITVMIVFMFNTFFADLGDISEAIGTRMDAVEVAASN